MTPSTEIDDANGNVVGSIAGLSPVMWADDSQQFCGITYSPYHLELLTLDGRRHPVSAITMPSWPGQMPPTPGLAACSVLSGRAIVVGGYNREIFSLSMISLTDGSIIYEHRYPNPVARLVASHDGRYVAEQIGTNASGNPTTLIRELPSGTVVGQVTDISVAGFSWDGSLVAGGTGGNASLPGAEVLRWQNHQLLWNQCACPSPFSVRVLAEPGGTKVAVVATDQRRQGTFSIVGLSGATPPVRLGNPPIDPAF
jgi:hypothetical protein